MYLVFRVSIALEEADEVLSVDVFDEDQFHTAIIQVRELAESLGGKLTPGRYTEQTHL